MFRDAGEPFAPYARLPPMTQFLLAGCKGPGHFNEGTMKMPARKTVQLSASETPSAARDGAAPTSPAAASGKLTGKDFAEYSHAMLLSLQKLARDQRANALSNLLAASAAEAQRLMTETRPA